MFEEVSADVGNFLLDRTIFTIAIRPDGNATLHVLL
jgi:hypothetical protein